LPRKEKKKRKGGKGKREYSGVGTKISITSESRKPTEGKTGGQKVKKK